MIRGPQIRSALLQPGMLLATALVVGCGADSTQEAVGARPHQAISARRINDIRTIDHLVPHVSTVHANFGDRVELFVREKIQSDGDEAASDGDRKPAVLMIAGATQPAMPVFDVPFENYSWMTHLAEAGFDVFAMDLTGYGSSPRPRMDDACNVAQDQQALLIPRPLLAPCAPSYPFKMDIRSDWDEIDRVVDFVRELRGVKRVSLVGWSRGAPRIGGYAARHPEKVQKLFLYAPAAYDRTRPAPPTLRPDLRDPPERGFLTQLGTIANFFNVWDSQVRLGTAAGCNNQFPPAIREVLRSSILASDPVSQLWGKPEQSPHLWRAPLQNTLWGWNTVDAKAIRVPTLIIRGELDLQAPEPQQKDLFADLVIEKKVFVRVACAGHQLVFENQHMVLLRASEEWLRDGSFAGDDHGTFRVDADGNVSESDGEEDLP